MRTVLAFDPGTANFAYCVSAGPTKIKAWGLIDPYKKAGDRKQMKALVRNVKLLIQAHKPAFVLIERFMFRGGGSTAAEAMNQAIAFVVLTCERLKVPWKMIPAAQWKNFGTKAWGYENDAKSKGRAKALSSRLFPKAPKNDSIHVVDAACIARYAWEKGWAKDPPL